MLLALTLLALSSLIVNVVTGEIPISPADAAGAIIGLEQASPEERFVVRELRLPRAIVGLLVGAALGVSGTILQGLTRNALASPDMLGITSGASLAAVSLIVVVPDVPLGIRPVAALLGAMIPALGVYLLARRGHVTPIRLLLVGIGIGSIASALTAIVLVRGGVVRVGQALIWMAGSLYSRSWEDLWLLLPWVAILVPLAVVGGRHLDALALGDDVAVALGGRVELSRKLLLMAAIALAAPHLARRLVGPLHGGLVPTAALVGAVIVGIADLLARSLFAPVEIPCGVVTAVVGGPYLLYLIRRGQHA
jgi:iron complex transport system permease protein